MNVRENIFVDTIHGDKLEYEIISVVQHLDGETPVEHIPGTKTSISGHYQCHLRVDSDSDSHLKFIKVSDSAEPCWSNISDVQKGQIFHYKLSKVHLNPETSGSDDIFDQADMIADSDSQDSDED